MLAEEELKKLIRDADKLYLNWKFNEAYGKYRDAYEGFKQGLLECPKNLPIKVVKTLEKIGIRDKFHEREYQSYIRLLLLEERFFPETVADRMLLMEKQPDLFFDKYFNVKFLSPEIAKKILSTINYSFYFHNSTTPQQAYNLFVGNDLESCKLFFKHLYHSYGWKEASVEQIKSIYEDLKYYGLLSNALLLQNDWGDTVAHKEIRFGSIENALIYLSYAKNFHTGFLKRYLYESKNHQGENWLYDVIKVSKDNLVEGFTNFLEEKRLEHIVLEKAIGTRDSYMRIAAKEENTGFVTNILSAVKKHSQISMVEQRIFNFEELKLSEIFSAKQEIALLREMGLQEYRSKETEYELDFVRNKQNVHIEGFSDAIERTIRKLAGYYGEGADFIEKKCSEFEEFFHSLDSNAYKDNLLTLVHGWKSTNFIESPVYSEKAVELFLKRTEFTLSRILDPRKFSKNYIQEIIEIAEERGWPQTAEPFKGMSLKHALAYSWVGLSDLTALSEQSIDEAEILKRKLSLVLVLYEVYEEGIKQEASEEYKDTKLDTGEGSSNNMEVDVTSAPEQMEIDSSRGQPPDVIDKNGGAICFTGLFDRMIASLDKMHKLVNIEVTKPIIKITKTILEKNFDLLIQELLNDDHVSPFILSRMYDNFDILKHNDLSKNFIPFQQHVLGLLKKSFSTRAADSFFGDIGNGLHGTDFIILEDVIKETSLFDHFNKDLIKKVEQADNSQWFYPVILRAFMQETELINSLKYPLLFHIYFPDKIKEYVPNHPLINTKLVEAIISLVNNKDLFKWFAEKFIATEPYSLFEEKTKELSIEINNKYLDEKSVLVEVTKAIRKLAEQREWSPYDIVMFHFISSEKQLYKLENILIESCKQAVISSNITMMEKIVNKAEAVYEMELANGLVSGNPREYNNLYLSAIAEKDFGNGFNILHLLAIHCKVPDVEKLFDFILHYHEFRNKLDIQNKQGCTPFYTAAFNNNKIAMMKFIEYGADTNLPDKHGNAPIHVVANHGDLEFIQYLITKGVNAFASDNLKNTFIHNAALAMKEQKEENSYEIFEEQLVSAIPIAGEMLPYFANFITELLGNGGGGAYDFVD